MSVSLQIIQGDCREQLRSLPDESVQCVVTSPPYWGLRDYGHRDQLGQERTPEEYVANIVKVFAEVHRVLRFDGTLWLNLGDSYAGSGRGPDTGSSSLQGSRENQAECRKGALRQQSRIGSHHGEPGHTCYRRPPSGYKAKDMVGIPWMVAFALRAAGWYLRQEIIWAKPNPMPESVTDRCTKAHEQIFLLSKSPRYWFDAEAIAEASVTDDLRRPYGSPGANALDMRGSDAQGAGAMRKSWNGSAFHTGKTAKHQLGRASKKRGEFAGKTNALPGREAFRAITETRNKRSVWTVPSQPYSGAHFATFPPELIKPCILAGCPRGGVVLDPFGGSGTTGAVALEVDRSAILCELNPEYVRLIRQRCEKSRPHWAEPIPQDIPVDELELFKATA